MIYRLSNLVGRYATKTSFYNLQINGVFPNTFNEYKKWDKEKDELPPEEVYKALFEELAYGEKIQIGRALTRMNYSKSGWKSLIKKTSRHCNCSPKSESF